MNIFLLVVFYSYSVDQEWMPYIKRLIASIENGDDKS
jgi:hypothetical protein